MYVIHYFKKKLCQLLSHEQFLKNVHKSKQTNKNKKQPHTQINKQTHFQTTWCSSKYKNVKRMGEKTLTETRHSPPQAI